MVDLLAVACETVAEPKENVRVQSPERLLGEVDERVVSPVNPVDRREWSLSHTEDGQETLQRSVMAKITLAHQAGEQFLGLILAEIVSKRLALVFGDDLLPQGNFRIEADDLVDSGALRERDHAPVDLLAPLFDEMAPFVPEAELHDSTDGGGYHLQLVTLDTRGGLIVKSQLFAGKYKMSLFRAHFQLVLSHKFEFQLSYN